MKNLVNRKQHLSILEINLEDEIMDFPPFLRKKIFLASKIKG